MNWGMEWDTSRENDLKTKAEYNGTERPRKRKTSGAFL